MAKEFPLEIITPQQAFWQQPAEALWLQGPFGSMTILAGHAPLVAGVSPQEMRLKAGGRWQTFCCAEGFLEVRPDAVLLFAQDCAWPQDLEAHRQREAEAAEEEQMLRRRGAHDVRSASITITRELVKAQHPELQQQD